MPTITVVTLSTGDETLLTQQAISALSQAKILVLRTSRHPITRWLNEQSIPYQSLDALYEKSENFDSFNRAATAKLLTFAQDEDLVYAVADATMDETVRALRACLPSTVALLVLPGITHADRCMAAFGIAADNTRLFAAETFRSARITPEEGVLLCELHSRECASECKLRLMALLAEDTQIWLLAGDADGSLTQRCLPLYELDRLPVYDHLTACYVPPVTMLNRTKFDMDDLVAVMTRLRAPDGCPWDKEQSHESLLTNLLEESYEFIGAVRDGDPDHMYDELGDVLLQVVFHAEIARQHGDFDINNVTTAITQKMIERHPHIFGTVKADTSAQVLDNWDAIKRSQRGFSSVAQAMDDVSTGLSAMMRADKVQHKAAKVGFDFPDAFAALDKIIEESDEVRECLQKGDDPEMELGDLYFSIINVSRLCKVNPDIALNASTNKFVERFKKMEKSIKRAGKSIEDLTLSEMDVYWEAEKHV